MSQINNKHHRCKCNLHNRRKKGRPAKTLFARSVTKRDVLQAIRATK